MGESAGEIIVSYGTLRDSAVQKEVIGRTVMTEQDFLKGFRKSKIELHGKTYPILINDSKGEIIEVSILVVTPDELKKIDEYETNAYRRTKIILESGKKAWVYQK